mmetsp:Transcript_37420/g.107805  ORF Transcript_37420/g.107805 Transcript_37420/m.107805 type:complete len:259 (+) Transcript_37420:2618-3394(+)
MPLEEASADTLVDGVREECNEIPQTHFRRVSSRSIVYSKTSKLLKPLETELIHGVSDDQLRHAEEEEARTEGVILVRLSDLVDLLLGHGSLCHGLADDCRGLLRILQGVNELFTLQDVPVSREKPQNIILDLLQLLGHGSVVLHQLLLLLLHLGLLLLHNDAKHLILQTLRRDCKVEHRDLNRDLWGVVRVCQGRRYVEPELVIIRYRFVSQFDDPRAAAVLNLLLLKDRLQGRVQGLPNVLQQDPLAKLDAKLHCLQ